MQDDLPEWEGSEAFWEARDKHAAGDLAGAFVAYADIIGSTVRDYADAELPYVAAALLAVAAVADESGERRSAVAAYNMAIRTIERNEARLAAYGWLGEAAAGARVRRDLLAATTDVGSSTE